MRYTKTQKDVLELITHLILTKPGAVIKLLAKHGIVFSFKPTRRDLIDQVIELLKQNNRSFNEDLEKLLSIHLEYKGIEIMALESDRALLNKEDLFLGGLIGGVAKGALGALGGLFGGGKSSGGGGGNSAGLAAAAAQAQQMKAQMEAKMQQMEADRRRQQEEAERRMREAEERQRREREEAERRRREEEASRRRAEAEKSGKGDSKSDNNNMLIIGGVAAVVVIGGIVLFAGSRKPAVAKAA
jgi:DNA repair exonuclease SbcCD ATPase subunit